ncbi:MAG: helix-turn-helix domain-containing protein, partial [Bacteroidota bacterium]
YWWRRPDGCQRERQSDIPLLTQYYLDLYRRKYQKTDLVLDKTSLQQLQRYPWPGNIRELRHAIERAVILSDGPQLRIADFVLQSGGENNMDQAASLDTYNLEEIERWAIRKVMTKHGGNISRAAEELGLTRATLYRRMEKYGL